MIGLKETFGKIHEDYIQVVNIQELNTMEALQWLLVLTKKTTSKNLNMMTTSFLTQEFNDSGLCKKIFSINF